MTQGRDISVTESKPMPKGYVFLPKGNQYKTLHCRRLTHEAGKPLFVVESGKKVLGIRVPKFIFFQVQSLARETLASRRATTKQRDATLIHQAAAQLDILFPNIPQNVREAGLRHGFRKHSGRVGRTSTIPMSQKVTLVVIAHIRHKHTQYDELLKNGTERTDARRAIVKQMHIVMRGWGWKGDLPRLIDYLD